MESLYSWMTENGLDPALIAYAGAAIACFALIKIFFFQKKNIAEIEKAARRETEQTAAEKTAAEKTAAEKTAAEKIAAEKIAAEKITVEKITAEQTAAEKTAVEQIAAEKIAPEKIAAEKAAVEKAAAEKIAAEKAAAEKAAVEKTAAETLAASPKVSLLAKMKAGLAKTKAGMSKQMGDLFLGAKEIDEELLEDLETILITADIGMKATSEIIGKLTAQVERSELKDPQALHKALKQELSDILHAVEKPLEIDKSQAPYVILMVGVNGVGKTTTIGKLAKKYQAEGKSVMLAAGDTFRAAAVEQLQVWGERNNVPVVAQHTGRIPPRYYLMQCNRRKLKVLMY